MFRASVLGTLLVAACSSSAFAAEPGEPSSPVPLAVVVRGGASLGSFEAGALHELTEIMRLNPGYLDPKVLAGTSAGSINGLVTAFTLYGVEPAPTEPEQSLYFRTWIPIGTKGMFDAKAVSATGAFTRSGAMAKVVANIGAFARTGLKKGSAILLAIPVTRLTPRALDLDKEGALQAKQAGETFVVRLTGRGPGVTPSITNVHDPEGPDVQPSLQSDDAGEIPLQRLVDVVLASSAIPPAFGPVNLAHCLGKRQDKGAVVCRAEDATTEAFVDGGFVDNLPLRLSTRLTKALGVHETAQYLLVDPQEMTFARLPKRKEEGASFAIIGERLLGGLVDAAQGTELRSVLDQEKRVGERLSVLQSELPLASSPLEAFMGFFETEFRTFDFALGMHESRRLARERFRTKTLAGRPVPTLPPLGGSSGMQRRVACLSALLDGEGDVASCGGNDLASFRALLQVSFERLYVQCRHLDAETVKRLHPERRREAWCLAAYRKDDPPRVPFLQNRYASWLPTPAERDDVIAYSTRRLEAYGFEWNDLEIGKASAERARVELSLRVGEILRAFASAQPQNTLLYRSAARALSQQLAYVPPAHSFHLLSGPSLELGYSVTRRATSYRSFRLATALVLDGIPSLFAGDAQSYFAMSPEVGIEVEPPWITNGNLQVRMLLRGGFQFSTGDQFLFDRSTPVVGTPLSRPVVDAAVAVTLLQWVRLQVGLAVMPPFQGEPTKFTFRPGLGLQLDLPL